MNNKKITSKEIRLIDADGVNLGMLPLEEAYKKAEEVDLDLVEVFPGVCKILNYDNYRYQQAKSSKQTKMPKLKEININTSVGEHDFQTKINLARKFLKKKHPLKIVIHQKERKITSTMEEIATRVINLLGVSPDVSQERRKIVMRVS